MTAPEHTSEETPATEPATEPVDVDALRDRARRAESRADAYSTVLKAAGIDIGDDGELDSDQLEQWHDQRLADEHNARLATILEAGFDKDSKQATVLLEDLAEGKFDAAVESGQVNAAGDKSRSQALAEYAETRYDYQPSAARYSLTEAEQLLGSRRLDGLQSASLSEATGEPQTEIEAKIIEAREAGDFARASMLQSEWERKKRARR